MTSNISIISWDIIIRENKYINTKKVSKTDEHSFCTLVDTPLTQSQNVTLGICMEKLFNDVVEKNTNMKDISESASKKGERQKDHIWLDEANRSVIYAEQKNNINLDTEKSVSTETKVAEIAKKYPDYTISAYIFAARYLSASEPLAKRIIQTKYKNTKVIGVNEYLALFNLPPFENYDVYKQVIQNVVETKFDSCNE